MAQATIARRALAGGVLALLVGLHSQTPAVAYSTSAEISASRSFSPTTVVAGDSIEVTITVEVGAIGADPLRGFYLSDHVPDALGHTTGSVTVGGETVAAITESTASGAIYAGFTTLRWVLETPPGWNQDKPVAATSTVVITYTVTIPADAAPASIDFPGFTWVGMVAAQASAGDHFGYEDGRPSITVAGASDEDAGANPADDPGERLTGGCSVNQPCSSPWVWLLLLVCAPFQRRRSGRRALARR